MSTLLSLENISYRHSNQTLLKNINFSLAKGQIVGLLGINGAGKSTTLKIAAGLLLADTGKRIQKTKSSLGFTPDIAPLLPTWTVRQFLKHTCQLRQLPKKKYAQSITHIVELLQLTAVLEKPCKTLSKGNQQRLNIAQALLHQPDILILDEPTSGLDPQQTYQFRQLLNRIKSHTAILFSSHIMQEITGLCDHAIVIHEGEQIGEIDLSKKDQQWLILFEQEVNAAIFKNHSAWQKGSGKQHHFHIENIQMGQELIDFCRRHHLLISRILGIEELAEQHFLSLIQDKNHYD